MTAFTQIRLAHDGAVSRLTLARPAAANAISLSLARQVRHAVEEVRDRSARVLVLAADGLSFCGGGDVAEMAAAPNVGEYLAELAGSFHEALAAMGDLDAVVIAAVDGAVAGGGLGLALTADVVIAGERARFLTAYEKIGVTPDSGVTFLLPRVIGLARALAMTTLGHIVDAEQAVEWGLAARAVASADLEHVVDALAAQLGAQPTAHIAQTRRMYRSTATYRDQLDAEAIGISASAATPNGSDAILAFAARSRR